MTDAQLTAFRMGLSTAAEHVAAPAASTPSALHREGITTMTTLFGKAFAIENRMHFDAGFTSLLLHAAVPLDDLRGRVEGWQ